MNKGNKSCTLTPGGGSSIDALAKSLINAKSGGNMRNSNKMMMGNDDPAADGLLGPDSPNLHQTVLNSIKTATNGIINNNDHHHNHIKQQTHQIGSPSSPSALSSSSISSSSSASSLTSSSSSSVSATIAAVQAILQQQQQQNNGNLSHQAALAAAMQVVNMVNSSNNNNNAHKELAKLNLDGNMNIYNQKPIKQQQQDSPSHHQPNLHQQLLLQSHQLNNLDTNSLLSIIAQNNNNNNNNNSPLKTKIQPQPAAKRNYTKQAKKPDMSPGGDMSKVDENNSSLFSNAAALMAAALSGQHHHHGANGINLSMLTANAAAAVAAHNSANASALKNKNKSGSARDLKSISPNSHGTSGSTCSDNDNASETLSSGSPPASLMINANIKSEYNVDEQELEEGEQSQLDCDENQLMINEAAVNKPSQDANCTANTEDDEDEESRCMNGMGDDDTEDNDDADNNNDSAHKQLMYNKQRNDSISSPARSSSSQTQSRSMSPANTSDYHHDSMASNGGLSFSDVGGDSAAFLAAQALLRQQNGGTAASVGAGLVSGNSLSFLSDAATVALLASSQPNSVASLVASRKRRNEKDMVERVKKIKSVPDDKKDEAYWERRRKNNDAAKRSRDLRRQKEDEIANRASFLEQENLKLKTQIAVLKTELSNLHCMLYKR